MTDIDPSTTPIQVEAVRFRSGVSEATLQAMGGAINALLAAVLPIGSIVHSMLTEAQFQELTSEGWVLADGGDCTSSTYATVTGNTTVPDLQGVFLRGKNHARSTGTGNTAGDLALGTYTADNFKAHTHSVAGTLLSAIGGDIETDGGSELSRIDQTVSGSSGGGETQPRHVTVNIFIRID